MSSSTIDVNTANNRVTDTFQAVNPVDGTKLVGDFKQDSLLNINHAAQVAQDCFLEYKSTTSQQRATFLQTIAQQLEDNRAVIVSRAQLESGLPEARLNGELGRTIGQLNLFANNLLNEGWQQAVIDTADPDRQPVAKPDIRSHNVAIGPVAVFGASNFPLAFSTAGGDTASALAAGCPVIMKGHPAHPGTSELVEQCINRALSDCHLPAGVFTLLQGTTNELGSELVRHPNIKAVGFTGSTTVGRLLMDIATSRPEPIPFYGELGSANPVYLLKNQLEKNAAQLAEQFVLSMTMGAGQFCTKPGLIFAIEGLGLDTFVKQSQLLLASQQPHTLLTQGIKQSYLASCKKRELELNITKVTNSAEDGKVFAKLYQISAQDWLNNPDFEEEIFGPQALIISCKDNEQLQELSEKLKGHLTATIHCNEEDFDQAERLTTILSNKVGRVLLNGWPTGVEVCHSMVHGGAYPAATMSNSTSVGSGAIYRWLRPVSYQNFPQALLPDVLRDDNSKGIWRQVNGQISKQSI